MILNDKVYLGDTLLDLGEANGVTLEYSISDPADMAAIFTPGSWTVNLPKSAVNLQAFGFMTEPGSTTDAPHKEHPCMVIRNGVPLFDSGKLTVIDVTDTINVVITWNTNERLTELSGRKLRDLAITKVMRWDPATFEASEDNDFKWVAETGYKQAGADGIMNYNARGFRPAVKASYLLAALLPGLTIGQAYWNRLENVWLMLPTTNGNDTIDAALTYRGYGAYSNYVPVLNVRDVMRNFKEYGTISATYDLLINQSSPSNPFSGLYIPKDGRYRIFGYIRTSSSAGGSELYNGKFRLMLNLSYDRDENGALVENYENLYYSEYPINSNNVFDVTVDLQAGDVVTIFNSYQLTNATISGDIAIDLNEVATENTDTGYLLDYPIRENLPDVGCIEFITALFSMVALQAQTSGTAVKVFSIDDVIGATDAIDISPYINDRDSRQLEYSHGLTADNVLSYVDETDAIHFAANTYNKTVNKVVELPFASGRDMALYRRDEDGRFEFVGEDTAMALARSGTASIRVVNDHINDIFTRTVTVSVFGFGGLDWATLYGTYWQGYKGVFADNQRVVKYNAVIPESFVRTLDFSKPVHDGVNRYLLMKVSEYTYTGACTLMMALLDGVEVSGGVLENVILADVAVPLLFDVNVEALYNPSLVGTGKLIRELTETVGALPAGAEIAVDLGTGEAKKWKPTFHDHPNKAVIDSLTQGHLDVLSHFSVEEGRIKVNTDLWSTGEVSAYGAGTGTGGGTVGSLGGLANVGLWADEVPASDRIMVQLAGATHWSSMLLSEIVGLDTVALGAYLSTNNYATQSYVSTKIAELVGTAPTTLDTLNELAAALGNDPNFATSMSTLIGTKWTQDNTKIANWDSAYNALHSHANKTELDGITSTLINNWNLAFTNNHTHPNKTIIDSLTQANLDVLAKLSIVDGNLKVDTNLWSTGEVSAYGAGIGTGGGGLITSVLGSAGLGGSYLDSDLTNTFNAYTINLINTNLTGALGRIGALETSTPNVSWGTPTAQYSPLTINSVTRNLSVDGHTHSSFLDLELKNIQGGDINHRLELGYSGRDYINWYEYGGLWKFIQRQGSIETELLQINPVNILYKGNAIWHAGNDGAGSGLDADLLRGVAPSNLAVLSATKLATSRTIWGQSFNGEWDVSGAITGATTGSFSSSVSAPLFDTSNGSLFSNPFWGTLIKLGSGISFDLGVVDSLANAIAGVPTGTNNFYFVGNVGIGTSSPSYKLDVNGTLRTTGAAYLNSTLAVTGTSTLTGLLTANGGINATTGTFSSYVTAQRFYTGYDSGQANSISCSNWFRSNGSSGWYNDTYGAGINSDTANIVRTYSTNKFKVYNTESDSIGTNGGIVAKSVGNDYNVAAFQALGNGSANTVFPTIGFHQPGLYASSIQLRSGGNFYFYQQGASGLANINAQVGTFSSDVNSNGSGNFAVNVSAGNALFATGRIFTGFDANIPNSISCSNWFRSSGATGWYNDTYGGGVYMDDATYVKVYGSKSFWVNGNIVATGEVTAYSASDLRLKTEVTTLKDSLRIIELLNPVSYKWNSTAKELNPLKSSETDYGLIAQELECVMPELVHSIYDGQYKSVDYIKIMPHLICAIKQLKMEIDNLKKTYY